MKILVADDDRMSRLRLEKYLSKLNYEVILCDDGNKAWDIIRNDITIGIYILDWLMPGIEGVDLCRRIRALEGEPYRYIMMITSKNKKDDLIAGMEAGADDYLAKPFYPHELRVRLRAARRIIEFSAELMETRALFRKQAMYDGLTAVLNRKAALGRLDEEIERSVRKNQSLGVVMIDLDHFKSVNDTHGHLAGDQVLRESVARIRGVLREYDVLGRYGGEEFILILPDIDLSGAETLCERIRSVISAEPMDTTEGIIDISTSLGLKIKQPDEPFTAEECIAAADKALYHSKNEGRNRVSVSTMFE